MKFDRYFDIFMRMPTPEKRVAQSLSPRYFSLSEKKFINEVRRRAYGTSYPRKTVIGRRLIQARARAQTRRARTRKTSRRPSMLNLMEQ
jgi:hypothetical protein